MDRRTARPSGTAQPAWPLAEALGRCNPDQRAPSPALAKEDVLYATRPKPPAQLIRATRSQCAEDQDIAVPRLSRPRTPLIGLIAGNKVTEGDPKAIACRRWNGCAEE